MELSVKEIIEATGGTLLCGSERLKVTGACVDSRKAEKGDIFVPLIGEKVDAHRFIKAVLEGETECSFTSSREAYEEVKDLGKTVILVEDTLKALQDMASYYRNHFELPIIGITRSFVSRAAATISFVVVFPTLPVIPTTGIERRERRKLPSACKAFFVSSTRISAPVNPSGAVSCSEESAQTAPFSIA